MRTGLEKEARKSVEAEILADSSRIATTDGSSATQPSGTQGNLMRHQEKRKSRMATQKEEEEEEEYQQPETHEDDRLWLLERQLAGG